MTVPTILRLKIDRFRGLKAIDWSPSPGLNLILGGGDVGKTTILDAIALLLSPVNPANLPDTDFYGREIEPGFSIEAVLSLPATIGIHTQLKPSWLWDWTGTDAIAPSLEAPTSAPGQPPTVEPAAAANGDARDRKAAFVADGTREPTVNSGRLTAPAGRYVVSAGSTIAAALITGLSSDLPGQVVAQVTEDVFDTVTGHTRLIPQGTRLIGVYDARVSYGQSRALVVWTRLIFPDGRSLDLDRMVGTDAAGQSGLTDRVNNHSGKLLMAGLLSTLFGVGANAATTGGGDNADIAFAIRESAGRSVESAGDKIVSRQLDVQPTITIRPGARVRVLVSRDLVLPSAGEN